MTTTTASRISIGGVPMQFSERAPVVLDIGSRYTKVGFAADFAPRSIVSSTVPPSGEPIPCSPDDNANHKATINWDEKGSFVPLFNRESSERENCDRIRRFLHYLYYNHLLVLPKDRRVVLVESVLRPTFERQCLASVLFDVFEVPSILFAPAHLLATMPFRSHCALVIDVSHRETLVMPICEGVPMLNCWEASPSAGHALFERTRALLHEHAVVELWGKSTPVSESEFADRLDSDDLIEDILVRGCFVTHATRGRQFQAHAAAKAADKSDMPKLPDAPPSVRYPLAGLRTLVVPGIVRESACEVLFENEGVDDQKSITQLVLDSVLRCPIDIRKRMLEHLLVIGGVAMLPGFLARLKAELLDKLADEYADRLPMNEVKFLHLQQPNMQNYLAWLGGSIFGSTEILPYRSLSREEWNQKRKVPDWTDKVDEIVLNGNVESQ